MDDKHESKRRVQNARITETMLGYEDHGLLTCMVFLDYGGTSQGFGGYRLDKPDGKGGAVGTAYGMEFIARLLQTVEVDQWEKLKGVPVRVDAELGKVHGIGHFLKDQWFYPSAIKVP